MITQSRLEKCLATVRSICTSPALDQYLIGYTAASAAWKGDQYRSREGFQHLVVLADRMSRDDALELETTLQRTIWSDPNDIACMKYHAEKREDGQPYSSYGGKKSDPSETSCSVYMAWWDKAS